MIHIEILKTYTIFFFLILHLFLVPSTEFLFFTMNHIVVLFYFSKFLVPVYLYKLNLYGYMLLLFQSMIISLSCKFLYPLYFYSCLEFTFFFHSNHFFLENFNHYLFLKKKECLVCYENINIIKRYFCCNCNICFSCSKKIFKCPICREQN